MEIKFEILNMTCEACVKICKMLLGELEGVEDIGIDLKSGKATLHADREISMDEIRNKLKETNYKIK